MKSPFRHLVVVALMWLLGLGAATFLLFAIGPTGQCAVEPGCGAEAERWWHALLLLLVALGPGAIATIVWLRSDDPAV